MNGSTIIWSISEESTRLGIVIRPAWLWQHFHLVYWWRGSNPRPFTDHGPSSLPTKPQLSLLWCMFFSFSSWLNNLLLGTRTVSMSIRTFVLVSLLLCLDLDWCPLTHLKACLKYFNKSKQTSKAISKSPISKSIDGIVLANDLRCSADQTFWTPVEAFVSMKRLWWGKWKEETKKMSHSYKMIIKEIAREEYDKL